MNERKNFSEKKKKRCVKLYVTSFYVKKRNIFNPLSARIFTDFGI